jgi:hypothetical protein
MGLCSQLALFSLVVTCSSNFIFSGYDSYAYVYWFYILEVNLISQIASGVIFMMLRGCIRPKVQLRPINETKCVPETDALTVHKDEIHLHTSFFTPFVLAKLLIGFRGFNTQNYWWCADVLFWS